MLIFSQWTRILDLLEVLLDDMNLAYLRLDGYVLVCMYYCVCTSVYV